VCVCCVRERASERERDIESEWQANADRHKEV